MLLGCMCLESQEVQFIFGDNHFMKHSTQLRIRLGDSGNADHELQHPDQQ
jgi:hypothetical protein